MVGLIDRDDPYHYDSEAALATFRPGPLITTWPCITEAMHLLYRAGGIEAQNELWGFVAYGLVSIFALSLTDSPRMQWLMNKYADLPLDMADASLVCAAERLRDRQLFSFDSGLRAVKFGPNGDQFFEIFPA